MKHFFTLLMTMLFSLSLLAQNNEAERRRNLGQARLSISSLTDRPLKIVIDGNTYNNRGNDNDINITDIRPGYHTIKIYQKKSDRNKGKFNNRSMPLVYDARIYVRSQYHVDIVINRFGKAFVDERQMNAAYYADMDEDHDGNGWNNYPAQVMNTRTFEQFRQVLHNESFDDSRLVLAKQTVSNNFFSAAQVKQLVQLFGFDNSKLELAQYAYKRTVDKNNYFILNDAFAYSSSKEALARYISANN